MSAFGLEAVEQELRRIRVMLERTTQGTPAALTYEEAARLLSCSSKHLRRLVQRGELATVPVGRLQRVPLSEIHRITALPEVGQARPKARPVARAAVPESVRLKALRAKKR